LPAVLYGHETWKLTLRVLENRVLRRVFWPKRDEVTGEWRKIHSDKFIDLYSSPIIDQVIKSRRMRWVGHVACMGHAYTGFWWGNQSKRDHMEDPGIGGRIILRRIFRKWGVGVYTGPIWLRIGTGGG
jgi:hypothetical protein